MIWLYIGLMALAVFSMVLTIIRMRRSAYVRKNGIHVSGRITNIRKIRTTRSGSFDELTVEYKERANSRAHSARATSIPGLYRIGDPYPVAYLADKPHIYAIDSKSGSVAIIIICLMLLLLVLFVIYKRIEW